MPGNLAALCPGGKLDAYEDVRSVGCRCADPRWRLGVHRIFNHLMYPWVKGYKKHPILYTNYKYLDLDVAAREAALNK